MVVSKTADIQSDPEFTQNFTLDENEQKRLCKICNTDNVGHMVWSLELLEL